MTTTFRFVAALMAWGLSFPGGSALADLTGTYEGRFKCTAVRNDGSTDKGPSTASTLKIIHHPNDLIDVDIDGTAYCGRVIATQPDKKGVGVFIVVGTNGNPNSYNEIEHITWKLSGKARVKKSGVWVDATQIGQCKGGWGRTSTEPPSGNFGLCNFFVALD